MFHWWVGHVIHTTAYIDLAVVVVTLDSRYRFKSTTINVCELILFKLLVAWCLLAFLSISHDLLCAEVTLNVMMLGQFRIVFGARFFREAR